MGVIEARRRIILNEPHIVAPTSAELVNFNTDMVAPLKECKVHFAPVQSGTGDPSPDNVRPISGWTGIDVIRCGEQLINLADYTISDGSKVAHSFSENTIRIIATSDNSTSMAQSSCRVRWNIPKCLIGKSVYVGCTNILNSNQNHDSRVIFEIRSENGSLITDPPVIRSGTRMYKSLITIPENSSYVNIEFRIAANITTYAVLKDDYVEFSDFYISFSDSYSPYTDTTLQIDWTDEAGTVYGGYVDLVRGEVVAEWGIYSITGEETFSETGSGQHVLTKPTMTEIDAIKPAASYVLSDVICTFAPTKTYNEINVSGETDGIGFGLNNFIIVGSIQYANWGSLVGEKIVFKLATPITYAITPQIIKSLKGANNIWSNANGNIELSYWTH